MAFEVLWGPDPPPSHPHLVYSAPATWPLRSLKMPSLHTPGPLHGLTPLPAIPSPAGSVSNHSSGDVPGHSGQGPSPLPAPPLVTLTSILSFANRALITRGNWVLACLFICLLSGEDITCFCFPSPLLWRNLCLLLPVGPAWLPVRLGSP